MMGQLFDFQDYKKCSACNKGKKNCDLKLVDENNMVKVIYTCPECLAGLKNWAKEQLQGKTFFVEDTKE